MKVAKCEYFGNNKKLAHRSTPVAADRQSSAAWHCLPSSRSPVYDETMKKPDANEGQAASELISKRIAELGDWRGKTLGRMRKLIREADPEVIEEWK